jgi:predicted small metal-binding protein
MGKAINCMQVVPHSGCTYVVRGATEAEILCNAAEHAQEHGILDMTPELMRTVKAAMQDVQGFEVPADLTYNRGLIADPAAFAGDANAASWLYLCGEEFSAMDGGMSYADVQSAVPASINVVSDPPRELDMDLARQHIAALDTLPRPTLVTCRSGGRSSAVIYLYAGLRAGATADEVLARAEADGALFCGSDETTSWLRQGMAELT